IHTMTGSFSCADLAGVQTFRYRQSSLTGAVLPCEWGGCMQAFAKASALRTPDQDLTGAGALPRRSPTGGAANGMPLKIEMPWSAVPLMAPPVTLTWVMSASVALMGNRASRISAMLRRFVSPLFFIPSKLSGPLVYNRAATFHLCTFACYRPADV